MTDYANDRLVLGWREWLSLPDLGLPAIKAKIDTGAKTSALHAFQVDSFSTDSGEFVRFRMHPLKRNRKLVVECEAPLRDTRMVTDSGGHKELRYVIETRLAVGDRSWPIEITLTNREDMQFRMLLGRRAMEERVLVDPAASYQAGVLDYRKLYGY